MSWSGRLFWRVYGYARVPIDAALEPLWWRLCRWRASQLRGMAEMHRGLYREAKEGASLGGMQVMDPDVQLQLAEECDLFATLLEEDSEG